MINDVKININKNYKEPITLKKLLLLHIPCMYCDVGDLNLQINIKPGVTLNLLDGCCDLETYKINIKFILNNDSYLHYNYYSYFLEFNNHNEFSKDKYFWKIFNFSSKKYLLSKKIDDKKIIWCSKDTEDFFSVYKSLKCTMSQEKRSRNFKISNQDQKYFYRNHNISSINRELVFEFVGENSEANIKILCLGQDDQEFNFKTIQNHKASNTKSDLVIRAVLDDNSKLKSNNLIRVAENIHGVDANQINKNILIGKNSSVVSIPKLEIKTDKVKCHHGAAIYKLDADQLFYIQSRGFNIIDSKNMIISAFLSR